MIRIIKEHSILISVLVIIILGFSVYANSMAGKFVWDDNALVKDNIHIKKWDNFPDFFKTDISGVEGEGIITYRPIQAVANAVDYTLWGLNPAGFHFTNIVLHLLASILVFYLALAFTNDKVAALTAGMLFTVHPIHTEAVAYISGRSDPLGLIFCALSFLIYIRLFHEFRAGRFMLMLGLYAIALLSRENSLILPALLLSYHYAFKKRIKPVLFAPVCCMAVVYGIARMIQARSFFEGVSEVPGFFQRLPGFFAAISGYCRLIVLPFHMHMEYGQKLFSFYNWRVVSGFVIAVSLIIFAVRARQKKDNIVCFSILFFLVALVPFSGIFPVNAYMAEHWLYMPSVGVFVLVGVCISRMYYKRKRRKTAMIIVGMFVLFFSYLTRGQNSYWSEPVVFYERTFKYAPHSARIANNLGQHYSEVGRKEEAEKLLKKAIELAPDKAQSYNNLAILYGTTGRAEEAFRLHEKAMQLDPSSSKSYVNMAITYESLGKSREAEKLFVKSIELNPGSVKAYYNLGNFYRKAEAYEKAVLMYSKAVDLDPDNSSAYNNLGNALQHLGRKKEAMIAYKAAIIADPRNAGAFSNIANVCIDMGRYDLAKMFLSKAIVVDPLNKYWPNNLAIVEKELGNSDNAIALCRQSIAIDPGFVKAHINLGNIYRDMGKEKDALKSYMQAVKLDPDRASVYFSISVIYFKKGDYEAASDFADMAVKRGLKVKPEYIEELREKTVVD